MELRRGVMVTPKFLALVFHVRIVAAQQTWQTRLKTNHELLTRTKYRWETRNVQFTPVA